MFKLNNLRALVTGSAGGIGFHSAMLLAKQGADVIIVDLKEPNYDEFKKATGQDAKYVACDLLNMEKTKTLFTELENQFGSIDILVNNAGIVENALGIPFPQITEKQLHKIMTVNFQSQFLLSQQAVVSMAKRKFGRIINIASIAAFTGYFGIADYSASKGAVLAMTKTIALEYVKQGITINCIAPGAINTNIANGQTGDSEDKFIQQVVPMGHMGEPQDVAAGVVFLASKEASYITGQALHINGGWIMH